MLVVINFGFFAIFVYSLACLDRMVRFRVWFWPCRRELLRRLIVYTF